MLAPRVGKSFLLAVTGKGNGLGNWDKPIPMSNEHYPFWSLTLDQQALEDPLEYKYVIVDRSTGAIASWEDRDNRKLSLPQITAESSKIILNDEKNLFIQLVITRLPDWLFLSFTQNRAGLWSRANSMT